jgi:uncharacterized membrane protein
MRAMSLLVLGLALFLGVHSISIAAPGWRDAQAARLGENAWKGIYTLLSLAGFALIVIGYGQARQAPLVLYVPPVALRHVAALLMLPVFVLLLAAYLPGRIKAATKHPMLVATKLWATAHLLANGNLADVLLFGGFLAWAVADRISMKHRVQRPLPGAPAGRLNDLIAVLAGLALYALFITVGHHWLIGVTPF